jgi:agmatinase
MADCGNVPIVPSEVVSNFNRITRAVEQAAERGALAAVVGGDHAITFPVVRGLSKFAPLNIVHFDAHLDYTHDVQDALYTHASPIRRCRELDFVGHITSVGIRSARRTPYEEAMRDGSLIISGRRFRELGPGAVADLIPTAENLYITFDVDVLDPSLAPGTGTPETGGLFYQETRDCLLALLGKSNLVAFDIVEVAPPYDNSQLTVQVAAKLMQDILAARFPSR